MKNSNRHRAVEHGTDTLGGPFTEKGRAAFGKKYPDTSPPPRANPAPGEERVSYGELLRLTEGHGTSEVHKLVCDLLARLRAVEEERRADNVRLTAIINQHTADKAELGHKLAQAEAVKGLSHRGLWAHEHDPANGRFHGNCTRCGEAWPCRWSPEGNAVAKAVEAAEQRVAALEAERDDTLVTLAQAEQRLRAVEAERDRACAESRAALEEVAQAEQRVAEYRNEIESRDEAIRSLEAIIRAFPGEGMVSEPRSSYE